MPCVVNLLHVSFGTAQIKNSQYEKLLEVTIYTKLSLMTHIQQICGKASAMLKALTRIVPFMNTEKKKLLMNAFLNAPFNYCPLVWMFHSRKLNKKINRISLRIVYNGNTSSFEEFLETDNSVSVHHKNIQILETELYKIVNGLSTVIIKDVFPLNNNLSYNTRNRRTFHSRPIRSVTYGSETLFHLAPKIWELVPTHLKSLQSVTSFKSAMKKWKPSDCPCHLCGRISFRLA